MINNATLDDPVRRSCPLSAHHLYSRIPLNIFFALMYLISLCNARTMLVMDDPCQRITISRYPSHQLSHSFMKWAPAYRVYILESMTQLHTYRPHLVSSKIPASVFIPGG